MNQYIAYIKKTITWLNQLAKDEGLNIIWVYWDYFWAVLLHRCLIRQYVIGDFWKLSYPERKRRLTYSRMVSLFNQCNKKEYEHYLSEKPDFNQYFNGFVKRAWLRSSECSLDEFIFFMQKYQTVIIKPVDGVEGGGIRKFSINSSSDIDLPQLYAQLREEDVLIEEVIRQHPRMVFGNTCVNTIRTHTVLDKNGKGHVVKAILRAGVGDSVVDNYAQGGSIYEVDLRTGVVNSYGKSKAGSLAIYHPGTDIVMLGYQIPNWKAVIEQSCKAAEHLPQVRIIGWDVAITNEGVELIEGNHNPDYELFEFLGSRGYYGKITKLL